MMVTSLVASLYIESQQFEEAEKTSSSFLFFSPSRNFFFRYSTNCCCRPATFTTTLSNDDNANDTMAHFSAEHSANWDQPTDSGPRWTSHLHPLKNINQNVSSIRPFLSSFYDLLLSNFYFFLLPLASLNKSTIGAWLISLANDSSQSFKSVNTQLRHTDWQS